MRYTVGSDATAAGDLSGLPKLSRLQNAGKLSAAPSRHLRFPRGPRIPMSYTESRSHLERAKGNTQDPAIIELANGLKHLSHAIEENLRSLEQNQREIMDKQIKIDESLRDIRRS
jgi:hypothetical protein